MAIDPGSHQILSDFVTSSGTADVNSAVGVLVRNINDGMDNLRQELQATVESEDGSAYDKAKARTTLAGLSLKGKFEYNGTYGESFGEKLLDFIQSNRESMMEDQDPTTQSLLENAEQLMGAINDMTPQERATPLADLIETDSEMSDELADLAGGGSAPPTTYAGSGSRMTRPPIMLGTMRGGPRIRPGEEPSTSTDAGADTGSGTGTDPGPGTTDKPAIDFTKALGMATIAVNRMLAEQIEQAEGNGSVFAMLQRQAIASRQMALPTSEEQVPQVLANLIGNVASFMGIEHDGPYTEELGQQILDTAPYYAEELGGFVNVRSILDKMAASAGMSTVDFAASYGLSEEDIENNTGMVNVLLTIMINKADELKREGALNDSILITTADKSPFSMIGSVLDFLSLMFEDIPGVKKWIDKARTFVADIEGKYNKAFNKDQPDAETSGGGGGGIDSIYEEADALVEESAGPSDDEITEEDIEDDVQAETNGADETADVNIFTFDAESGETTPGEPAAETEVSDADTGVNIFTFETDEPQTQADLTRRDFCDTRAELCGLNSGTGSPALTPGPARIG